MRTVNSKAGTKIAFDQYGDGPTLILVTGALGVRSPHPMSRQLSELLSQHFTVIDYDRRGRGDSGDTQPYAVQREVEDLEALIDANSGSAFLYGLSSGAVLALEAASRLPGKVKKLAMYEPPFIVDDSRPPVHRVPLKNERTAFDFAGLRAGADETARVDEFARQVRGNFKTAARSFGPASGILDRIGHRGEGARQ